MKRRAGFLALVLIAVVGCSGIGDMGKTADLKGCKKFAQKETNRKQAWPKLINSCMEREGHYGFDFNQFEKENQ